MLETQKNIAFFIAGLLAEIRKAKAKKATILKSIFKVYC